MSLETQNERDRVLAILRYMAAVTPEGQWPVIGPVLKEVFRAVQKGDKFVPPEGMPERELDHEKGEIDQTIDNLIGSDDVAFYKNTFHGKPFRLCTQGSAEPRKLVMSFYLESDIRDKWWNVQEGDVVLDVGAGFGSYAVTALACGASMVIAWEPGRLEFFDLTTQVLVNDYKGAARLFNTLAGVDGFCTEYYPFTRSHRPQGIRESRMVLSVDSVALQMEVQKVDWLKIDVEGDELAVLEGAKRTLERFNPQVIVECHEGFEPGITGKVVLFMESAGYKMKDVKFGEGHNEIWQLWGNWQGFKHPLEEKK